MLQFISFSICFHSFFQLSRPALSTDSGDVIVRSFEEIMREKRLRKQQEGQSQQKIVDAKPIQGFLRRRSLSNQRNTQHPVADNQNPSKKNLASPRNETKQEDEPPKASSENATTTLIKEAAPPVARIIGRRRSSSPSVEIKSAPVKLKRKFSNSDSKVPGSAPTPVGITKPVVESASDVFEDVKDGEVPDNTELAKENIQPVETVPESSMEDIQEALYVYLLFFSINL